MFNSGFVAYDIYGSSARSANMEVEEPVTQISSGKYSINDMGSTVSWLGIIVALIIVRVVYEFS